MFYLIYLMPIPYPARYTTAPALENFDVTGVRVDDGWGPWRYQESPWAKNKQKVMCDRHPLNPFSYFDGSPPPPEPIAAINAVTTIRYFNRDILPAGRSIQYVPSRDYRTNAKYWKRVELWPGGVKGIEVDATGVLLAEGETEKSMFMALCKFRSINKLQHLRYTWICKYLYDYNSGTKNHFTETIKSIVLYDMVPAEKLARTDDNLFRVQFYIHEGDHPPHYECPPNPVMDKFATEWFARRDESGHISMYDSLAERLRGE